MSSSSREGSVLFIFCDGQIFTPPIGIENVHVILDGVLVGYELYTNSLQETDWVPECYSQNNQKEKFSINDSELLSL